MKPPETRSIVLVATDDDAFEETALHAVMESGHGLRRVHDIRGACRTLGKGTRDIALAIIDLDLEKRGRSLLHLLGGCEPPFPILAVTSGPCAGGLCENLCRLAADQLVKPVTVDHLCQRIQEIVRHHETVDESPLPRGVPA